MNASAEDAADVATHRGAGRPETMPTMAAVTRRWERLAEPLLRMAAAAWLCVALAGQLLFAVYVVGFYGRAAVQGKPENWNHVLAHGYVRGDDFFNLVLAMHLLFAVLIIFGGAMQLLPWLRRRASAFHRWNGRAYLAMASMAGVGGLLMVWVRGGVVGDLSQHIMISINALLILCFAWIAWRHARARRFDAHRRWAMRLFLVVSGVWFFRVGLMFWIVVNRGPVGFDPNSFTGPFLTLLGLAQYLLPLGMLELYLRARQGGGPGARLIVAAGLGMSTLVMAVGIAAAAGILWLPHLRS